jgi:hypothetical protein
MSQPKSATSTTTLKEPLKERVRAIERRSKIG